jgi:hypothetical protein
MRKFLLIGILLATALGRECQKPKDLPRHKYRQQR